MKQKLRNIKLKAKALWWLLTHTRYELVVWCNEVRARELGNIKPSDVVWIVQYANGMMTTKDLFKELNGIASMAVNDKLVYNEIKQLIKMLEEEQ